MTCPKRLIPLELKIWGVSVKKKNCIEGLDKTAPVNVLVGVEEFNVPSPLELVISTNDLDNPKK